MGKKKMYKKLCKEYADFICDAFDSAANSLDFATRILKEWKPSKKHGLPKSKRHGLSKDEVRAAFRGFAVGVANGADAAVRGKRFGDENDGEVIDWLLSNVANGQADDDRASVKVVEVNPDAIVDIDLDGFMEALFGTDDESE